MKAASQTDIYLMFGLTNSAELGTPGLKQYFERESAVNGFPGCLVRLQLDSISSCGEAPFAAQRVFLR